MPERPPRRRADRQSGLRRGGEVLDLLRVSADEYRQTTLIVTHDPRDAAVADRVLFLADGQIIKEVRDSNAPEVLAAMQEVARRQLGETSPTRWP